MATYDTYFEGAATPKYWTVMINQEGDEWESQESFELYEDARDDVKDALEHNACFLKGHIRNRNGENIATIKREQKVDKAPAAAGGIH
ncbi:MAG: hypothetical protein JWM44_2067 [Bacilli bacterium]|nr:hypothetical protein [Bacilli bacterium]